MLESEEIKHDCWGMWHVHGGEKSQKFLGSTSGEDVGLPVAADSGVSVWIAPNKLFTRRFLVNIWKPHNHGAQNEWIIVTFLIPILDFWEGALSAICQGLMKVCAWNDYAGFEIKVLINWCKLGWLESKDTFLIFWPKYWFKNSISFENECKPILRIDDEHVCSLQ